MGPHLCLHRNKSNSSPGPTSPVMNERNNDFHFFPEQLSLRRPHFMCKWIKSLPPRYFMWPGGVGPPPPLFSYIHGLMSNGFIGKATCVDRTWQFPPPSVLLLRTRPNSHILLVRTRARGSARGRPRGRPLGRPREDHGDGLQRIQRLYRESRKFLRPVDTSVATVGGDERDTTVTT